MDIANTSDQARPSHLGASRAVSPRALRSAAIGAARRGDGQKRLPAPVEFLLSVKPAARRFFPRQTLFSRGRFAE
ncbi:hypothetical protein PSPO01_13551 [Paraphaeosphaeria sporulosa]